jgi:hypothetical protein
MALVFSNLTSVNQTTTNPVTSASVNVPNNALCLISYGASQTAPNVAGTGAVTAAPAGLTFVEVGRAFLNPRQIQVFAAVNTSGSTVSGTIDVTYTPDSGGTITGHNLVIDLVEGVDTTTPYDTAVTNSAATATLTAPDVGTPGTGDAVYAAAFTSNPASDLVIDSPYTFLARVTGGNTRQLASGYDAATTPDETPSATSGASASMGIVAFIVNVAATVEDIYTQTDGLAPQAWQWIPPTSTQLGRYQGSFPNIAAGVEDLQTFKLHENAERAVISWQHWKRFIPPNASYTLPEETSGTVFNEDFTEALTLSDVVDAAVAYAVSVTENLALTDSVSNTAILASSLTEGLSLTDVVTAVGIYAASITESLTLTDSVDGALGASTYNDSVTESLALSDTVSAIVTYAAALVESLNQTDSVSATFDTAASITEALALTDSISSDATSQIIEALSLTDSYTGDVTTSTDFVESLSLLDIVTAAIAYAVVVEEGLNLTDSVSATGTMFISVTENLNLSDTTNASVTPAGGSTQRVYIG